MVEDIAAAVAIVIARAGLAALANADLYRRSDRTVSAGSRLRYTDCARIRSEPICNGAEVNRPDLRLVQGRPAPADKPVR